MRFMKFAALSPLLLVGVVLFVAVKPVFAEITRPYTVDEKPQVLFGDSMATSTYKGLENYTREYVNGYVHITYTYTHDRCCYASNPPSIYITNVDPRTVTTPAKGVIGIVYYLFSDPTDLYFFDVQFDATGYTIAMKRSATTTASIRHENVSGLADTDWVSLANQYPFNPPSQFSMAFTPLPIKAIPQGPQNSNILFLPGIEASRLYRPDYNGGTIKAWEPWGDNFAENIKMDTDGAAVRDDIYTRDVIDNAYLPIKGNVYASFLDQLDAMKNAGHVIEDYAVIPYDWRLSLDDILNNGARTSDGRLYYSGPLAATSTPYVIQELRRLAAGSPTGKVTIVAHSNGGLLAKALTEKLGAEASQLIDKMIFVAVPQAGTPKAIGAILHGFDTALPIKPLSFFGLSETMARELARNMPSIYNLLPSENYFTYVNDPVITISNDPLLAPWRAAYGGTIHSEELLHKFITDQSRTTLPVADTLISPIIGNESLLNKSETLHNTQDAWTPPAGVELTEIAGWGMGTLKTIAYYQGVVSTCTAWTSTTCAAVTKTPVLEYKPETVLDGDGTVLVPSALWTHNAQKYWVDLRSYNLSNIGTILLNRKHGDIMEVPQLRAFIQNLIISTTTASLSEFIYTSTPAETTLDKTLHFTLHSPLTLNLYDDQGNHTGYSTTTNSLEENIPDSQYMKFGEVQYISAPSSENLRLFMDGETAGSFTLDIEETEGNTVIATTTFAGIPTLADTKVTLDIPKNGGIERASDLEVDIQDDGIADFELAPKLGDTVTFRAPATVRAEDKTIILGGAIPFLTASATDALGNMLVAENFAGAPECTTTATVTSPAGTYLITCSIGTLSSDKYEFTEFVSGTLAIKYGWSGFLAPIKNDESVFKAGSTVPVKFKLKKSDGMPAQAATAPLWLSPVEGSTGDAYRFDLANKQYIYNWSTEGLVAGSYRIGAQLDDGNEYHVKVGLK